MAAADDVIARLLAEAGLADRAQRVAFVMYRLRRGSATGVCELIDRDARSA